MKKNEIKNILKKQEHDYCKLWFDLLKKPKYMKDLELANCIFSATTILQEATNKIIELVK